MKKYVKIALLVIVALIFIGTFVFLYQKSQPKASVYTILNAEITDLKKTTVATGKIEPRDEILIKPQISGIIDEVYKEAGQKIKKGEVIAKVGSTGMSTGNHLHFQMEKDGIVFDPSWIIDFKSTENRDDS